MRVRRVILVLLILILASLACTAPGQAPVTVVVTVVQPPSSASQGAPQPVDQTTATSEGTQAPVSSVVMIQAKANVQVAIRKKPGVGCDIIGYVEQNETINLLERTDWNPHWYKTDKLGPDTPGWVYNEYFTLLADDSILPRVPEKGCLYCGDGVCTAEIGEACDVCVADCGVCPKCGDGVVNQPSEACDGSASVCPVDGSRCNSSCQCVAPKPKCGDGKINQPSEVCDGSNKGCKSGWTCNTKCTCDAPPITIK